MMEVEGSRTAYDVLTEVENLRQEVKAMCRTGTETCYGVFEGLTVGYSSGSCGRGGPPITVT
jgi:hypothetical protein